MSASSNIIATIRRILIGVAKKSGTITYSDLGAIIGKPDIRHWPELDILCDEETQAGKPDLTLVVVAKDTGLPSRFNRRHMDAEDWDRNTVKSYYTRRKLLYDYYGSAK